MDNKIILDGTRYVQYPTDPALYNEKGVYVNLTLDLENWNYDGSSQIIGNYNGQGYGIFYNKGFEDNPDLTLIDSGNDHLFNLNHFGGLISQRSITNVDAEFTAYVIDHLGNKYYFDQANLLCHKFDGNNIPVGEPFSIVADSVVSVIVPDKYGNIYFMDTASKMIHKYSPNGDFISSLSPTHPEHNNMVVMADDTINTFFSSDGTPMVTDSEGNYYNLWGVNIYKNGKPWFFVGSNANTLNIDMDDNIWAVHSNNRLLKINTFGVIEFDRVFHNIKPCVDDAVCDTVKESTHKACIGFTKFDGDISVWVILNEFNYLLRLSTNGITNGCELVSNLLDVSIYPDADYGSMNLLTNGDFTGFNTRKRFSTVDVNNSRIVAKIALIDPCDDTVSFRELTSDVTSLDGGEHNIVFGYDTINGVGELIIDGFVVDRMEETGLVYYKTSNRTPFLIGADSGNYRSKRGEQGMDEGGYLKANITDLLLSTRPQTRQLNTISLKDMSIEFPSTVPISFKERVDKMFLMRPSGFKSTRYDVTLMETGIVNREVMDSVELDVAGILKENTSVSNELDEIKWKNCVRFNEFLSPWDILAGWIDEESWDDDEEWIDNNRRRFTPQDLCDTRNDN